VIVNEVLEERLDLGVTVGIVGGRNKEVAEDVLAAAADVQAALDRFDESQAVLFPSRGGFVGDNRLKRNRKTKLDQLSKADLLVARAAAVIKPAETPLNHQNLAVKDATMPDIARQRESTFQYG
jgi:hypothetical protein